MTDRKNAGKHIKASNRRTPYDVRVEGTFAERPPAPKAAPRGPTKKETEANNNAMGKFSESVADIEPLIPGFKEELERMNRGKRGRPFSFCDSFVIWVICFMTHNDIGYRKVSGQLGPILRPHGLRPPSYSRLCERALELAGRLPRGARRGDGVLLAVACDNVADRERSVGIDSTGIGLSGAGVWREAVWGDVKRGWVKFHALSDTDSGEIIAYAVTEKGVGDGPMLAPLVGRAAGRGHRFHTLYADNAYCSNENWRLVSGMGVGFVTSFRSDTRPTNNGCPARGDGARVWCAHPYGEWVRISGYGTRWKCECVFSSFKSLFPEAVSARSARGVVLQLYVRAHLFNGYKAVRAGIMGTTGNGVAIA